MFNTQDYLRLLQKLLPPGKAWTRDIDSRLTQLMHGEAEELARVDARSEDLKRERDTRRTLELITEHEADFDLPDICTDPAETITES